MGQVTAAPAGPIDAVSELQRDNPAIRAIDATVCADALRTYIEAAENVRRNGAVCMHPRTGAPIENPYLKIQATQGAILRKMRAVKSDRVLALLNAERRLPPATPARPGE